MKSKQILTWTARFMLLLLLYIVLFIAGSIPLAGLLPDVASEPGLLPNEIGLLVFGIANTLLIIGLILSSQWHGWKLAITLSFAYYGAVTFLPQIESWYFLSNITVDEKILTQLFVSGLPIAFIYIPLAVWILGKWRPKTGSKSDPKEVMPAKQWLWKLALIAVAYVLLYWNAGYFIAWQNPELRAFYGSPGEIVPFWQHTAATFSNDPGLFAFQILRGILWALCAYPIIRGSKISTWFTAILVGLLFTLPMILGLMLENPLMPSASVRLSHIIETGTSNFIFALIIVWLLHRPHSSVKDLFGIKPKIKSDTITKQFT
ncbi:MAG: hypothetical protein OEM04_09665 [Flavobacteriaceae bacterium]|nr:hypothetical protein [Flavobacteriaceae bacterium]